MSLNGMDGTNTISGEISGLQRHIRHITPHTKYMNCSNHKLALMFVHLLDQYEVLKAVDTSLRASFCKNQAGTDSLKC